MTAYLLRRLLSLSLSLIAASLVIFLVMEVVPGDPASFMMASMLIPRPSPPCGPSSASISRCRFGISAG
jgi:ABC-type dipeptide/oligopeptide/nickel transport system permease component